VGSGCGTETGTEQWSEGDRDAEDELAQYTLAALDELRAASASLG
jgi:hypothetical protein